MLSGNIPNQTDTFTYEKIYAFPFKYPIGMRVLKYITTIMINMNNTAEVHPVYLTRFP